MCGIVGIYDFNHGFVSRDIIQIMTRALQHRGPDDQNVWFYNNIGLGHARLSVQDLSNNGNQPMYSFSRRWIIVFNGEVYNFTEIREQLLLENNILFKGSSDTEVLVNAIDLWGIDKTLSRLIGMFAFAAYNIQEKELYIARDRFGEKPLYYGMQKNIFSFSSELSAMKPLRKIGWRFDVDTNVLTSYLRWSNVASPYSIFKNIKKLDSGCYLKLDAFGKLSINKYWDIVNVASTQKDDLFEGSYFDAINILEEKILQSVRMQSKSDVPLGAFLSGGVDSSLVVALMQHTSSSPVRTFSIGFKDQRYNEAPFAKKVAKHLGTHHSELYLSNEDIAEAIPQMAKVYSEPFADSSQIPTFLVSKLARKDVTVAMSGDGGDELFGGYGRYFNVPKIANRVGRLNYFYKLTASYLTGGMSRGCAALGFNRYNIINRLDKISCVLSSKKSEYGLYPLLISHECRPDRIMTNDNEVVTGHGLTFENFSLQEYMMLLDAKTYLQDDILVKVDRAAMFNSLETRVPLLDHRIFEFAWNLPLDYKIRGGQGKIILCDILYKYIPREIVDRPKRGFAMPYSELLRTYLFDWVENLLSAKSLNSHGFFDVKLVQNYWESHLKRQGDFSDKLWIILMFQQWYNEWNCCTGGVAASV